MSDFPVLFTRGPATYVDSADAVTDHSGLPFVPMRKDLTALLLGLGNVDLDATGAPSPWTLSLTAYETFDGGSGTVIAVLPILEPWSPAVGFADSPDTWTASPVTRTGAIVAGQTVTLDVSSFMATAVGGKAFFGWKVYRTDVGSAGGFYGPQILDDRSPSLLGQWSYDPTVPTGQVPSTGAVVGTKRPTYTIDNRDLTALQFQLENGTPSAWNKDTGYSSPLFDSGTVTTTDPEFVSDPTAHPDLAVLTNYYWTIRTQDESGWSEYTPPVGPFTYVAKSVITITNPTFGVTGDPNPLYTWTTTGTQTAYQVLTYPQGLVASVMDDSTQVPSAVGSYQPVGKYLLGTAKDGAVLLPDGRFVTGEVRVWDDVDGRVATPGCPVYSVATEDYQFANNETIPPPDSVSAFQVYASQVVDINVVVSGAVPDHIIFTSGANTDVDVHIARKKPANLEGPVDVEGGKQYTLRWWGTQPWQPGYVFGAKLVYGNQTSKAEYASLDSLEVVGMWFSDADPASDTYNVFAWHSGDGSQFSRTDQIGVNMAYGSSFPSIDWRNHGAIEGACQGTIRDAYDVTASDWQKNLRILASRGQVVQQAFLDTSMPAVLYNYAPNELQGTGSPFLKQVTHKSIQIDNQSFADEPPNFGEPTLFVADFEEGVDGDPIVKESLGGSPGVVDKDGNPLYSVDAEQHGVLGADLGWRA